MIAPAPTARLTFGLFEADLSTGELWKAGFRIKLQSQPFKVLATLLERPGQVVTREELQERLWGKDTVVDFDHSLGTAINKIREALGDNAENPRFIETLSKRGYRFIAPVSEIVIERVQERIQERIQERVQEPGQPRVVESHRIATQPDAPPASELHRQPTPIAATLASAPAPILVPVTPSKRRPVIWGAAVIVLGGAIGSGYFIGSNRSTTVPPHIAQITHNGHLAPSAAGMENLAAVATDGVHLFAATIESGQTMISAVSLSGGSVVPLNIPSEVASPALGDISPDGSRLLLRDHLSPESEQPLWVVPTIGGSALRVGNVLAHDATWMPTSTMPAGPTGDNAILFANGNQLFLTHLNGNDPQLYATLPGRALWLRWEPNGHLLRFTISDPLAHTLSLWQLSPTDRKAEPVLTGFTQPANECCGIWTPDGRNFVFQSTRGGNTDLWRLRGESTSDPIRLTDGPLQFQSPVAARPNTQGISRIFFLGEDARSELETVSPTGELLPVKGFLSTAIRIDYSRDGRWVAWTDTGGQLWRARADGTDRLQLSPDGQDVFLAHWSPDGSLLAAMAREPGKAWQLYLTSANGGGFQPLLRETRNAADPSWSPDGQSLVFGRVNDEMGKENAARTLQILHLSSGAVETVPGSDGLFSPRWSPDGRYIAALSLDQQQVRLYNVATRTWTRLNVPSGADPVWSADSRSLYVHASLDPSQPIDRISIPDGKVDIITRLANTGGDNAVDYVFGGLTLDKRPFIRARVFTGNLYSLEIK